MAMTGPRYAYINICGKNIRFHKRKGAYHAEITINNTVHALKFFRDFTHDPYMRYFIDGVAFESPYGVNAAFSMHIINTIHANLTAWQCIDFITPEERADKSVIYNALGIPFYVSQAIDGTCWRYMSDTISDEAYEYTSPEYTSPWFESAMVHPHKTHFCQWVSETVHTREMQ